MNDISVIVPIYNSEAYIKKCVDSIIKSKKNLRELILIDDGSTDSSASICRKYEQKYNFIKYTYQKNRGPSAARNLGLKLAKGKYIMFVDSDDYIDDLSNVFFDTNEQDSDYYIFYRMSRIINNKIITNGACFKEGKYVLKDNIDIVRKMIEKEIINSPCSRLYKKEIIDKNNIRFDTEVSIAEDLLFNVEYISYCNDFVISNKSFYNYCFNREESLTQKYIENKYKMLMSVNNKLKVFFDKMEIDLMYRFLVYKNIYSCIRSMHHQDCKLSKKTKINLIKKYKKEHKDKLIFGCGIKMTIWSFCFNYMPSTIIYHVVF